MITVLVVILLVLPTIIGVTLVAEWSYIAVKIATRRKPK